jgi:hypothetical protein
MISEKKITEDMLKGITHSSMAKLTQLHEE